eukprot:scaffold4980_cov323-Prasinococcus_capsulatus_cf.AAC.1
MDGAREGGDAAQDGAVRGSPSRARVRPRVAARLGRRRPRLGAAGHRPRKPSHVCAGARASCVCRCAASLQPTNQPTNPARDAQLPSPG